MKNILLVGGEGYIGNVVSNKLLHSGFNVVSYDNLLYKNNNCVLNKINYSNYKFIFGDILDEKKLLSAMNDIDAVVLFAGLVGDPITKKYPQESAKINDDGVKSVIDSCHKMDIEKLIFISTCSNYGLIKNDELANEENELNPLSLYAKSKVNIEKYILSLKGKTNLNPTILRFATAFGLSPRMRFDLTISEFTYEIFNRNELLVYDAHTWRPYCHVSDFAKLIELVINSPNEKVSFEVFNAGGDMNNATKKMLIDLILEIIPYGKVKYQENGNDPRNYRVSFDKVKSLLGFKPDYTVLDGVNELISALENNLFHDVSFNRNYYGNYQINYPINK